MQEVVPADATNSTGKTYAEATAEEKKAGGFVKDGWTYSAASYDVTVAVSDKEVGKQDGDLVIHVTGTPEITVTGQDTEEVSAEAGFVNKLGFGSLEVTKHLKLYAGSEEEYEDIYAVDQTFKVALFEDEDCKTKVGTERNIEFKNATVSSVTFDNLEAGKTYYVAELTEDGKVTKNKESVRIDSLGLSCIVEFETTNEAKVERDGDIVRISFDNVFTELPEHFYREADLTITKKTLKNGEKTTTNETFYAGIFADKELTELSDDVSANIVELAMNGKSEVTSDPIKVSVGKGDSFELYIAETDEDGNPVKDKASFKYTVSYSKKSVTISEENLHDSVIITNDEETVTPTPSTPPTTPPGVRTGDDTPVGAYLTLVLMALAAALIAFMALRRRKQLK